jgi:methyl-accepting chemotaxis protein
MFDWLSSMFSDQEVDEINTLVAVPPARRELDGLDYSAIVESHLRWKALLADAIAGRASERLDVATAARADRCALGQWMDGAGKRRFGGLPDFEELRAAHAAFHNHAGEILRLAQAGRREEARQMLTSGDYFKDSMRVIRQLSRVWNRA